MGFLVDGGRRHLPFENGCFIQGGFTSEQPAEAVYRGYWMGPRTFFGGVRGHYLELQTYS
jgi:hypothetical protein